MYSGYVDYKGLRLAQFSESRLDRLQERVNKQYGLAKRAYKAAESQVMLGENPGTATLEAIGVRVKCLRILKEAVDAKSFLEATDVPAHGEGVAARHKAELDKALEQLRLVEAVGLAEDDQYLGPVLKARRLKAAQAKRQYDGSSNLATYDAILRRQLHAAQALVSAAERLTDLVADNSQDEAAVAVAEAAVNAAVAHWRQRRTASDKALNIIEASFESSAYHSTVSSSFEVVGRPTSGSTTASASFLRSTAGSSTRPYEPELAGSSFNTTAASRHSASASMAASRPSASASMAAARPSAPAPLVASRLSTSASAPGYGNLPEAPANTSGFSNFFDFTPMAVSTPLPGLDETGPIGDVPSRASGAEFGYGPTAASSSSANATGNQALDSDLVFHANTLSFFAQALWRKIRELGLAVLYKTVKKARILLRCFGALATVPVEDVPQALEAVVQELNVLLHETAEIPMENNGALSSFLEYFEKTYVRRLDDAGNFAEPRFRPMLWNCFPAILQELHRTNNAVEGWHMEFNKTFTTAHPALDKFIHQLQNDEDKNRQRLVR